MVHDHTPVWNQGAIKDDQSPFVRAVLRCLSTPARTFRRGRSWFRRRCDLSGHQFPNACCLVISAVMSDRTSFTAQRVALSAGSTCSRSNRSRSNTSCASCSEVMIKCPAPARNVPSRPHGIGRGVDTDPPCRQRPRGRMRRRRYRPTSTHTGRHQRTSTPCPSRSSPCTYRKASPASCQQVRAKLSVTCGNSLKTGRNTRITDVTTRS